jgi:putative transposase
MRFIVNDTRVIIYGFVIMANHIHITWQMKAGRPSENVQRDFLKHTAQEIKSDMVRRRLPELDQYFVNAKDRKYQIWERNALSVDLWSEKALIQKLKYIHKIHCGQVRINILRNINIHRPCFTKQGLIIGDFLRIIVIN